MTRITATLFLAAMWLNSAVTAADDKPKDKPSVKVEFRRAEKEAAEGLTEATVEGSKDKVYLHKTVELTNDDVAEARATLLEKDGPAVELTLTKEGAMKMEKLTKDHLNKPLAILVDGKVIIAPVVKTVISERILITGHFTLEEVGKLAKGIKGK
jgi:preprotein translocase subunit SecD